MKRSRLYKEPKQKVALTKKEETSYIVYGLWFLAWVVLELLGYGPIARRFHTPWFTLSETGWSIEHHSSTARIVIFAGLAILLVHIVFGFPNNPLP